MYRIASACCPGAFVSVENIYKCSPGLLLKVKITTAQTSSVICPLLWPLRMFPMCPHHKYHAELWRTNATLEVWFHFLHTDFPCRTQVLTLPIGKDERRHLPNADSLLWQSDFRLPCCPCVNSYEGEFWLKITLPCLSRSREIQEAPGVEFFPSI